MANSIINEYKPEFVSHPGLTLLDILEEKGLTQKELAQRMGRPINKINKIIKGKLIITPTTALQLEKVLSVSASFWNTRQKQFDEYIAYSIEKELLSNHVSWVNNFPIKEMIKNVWINKQNDKILQLKELLSFFGISSPEEWNTIWTSPKVAYKQSSAFNTKPEANSVWLRQGEIKAQNILCNNFNLIEFKKSLNVIRSFIKTSPDNFDKQMVELCANAGAALVFVPRPKGLPVYGITRWLTKDKALIQLSLYRKYEDYFWFAFFHEAAHIILHGKSEIFIEANSKTTDEKELEADIYASNFLIPDKKWKKFVSQKEFDETSIHNFANQNEICPGVVVGRLQREKYIKFYQMNHLRRKINFN